MSVLDLRKDGAVTTAALAEIRGQQNRADTAVRFRRGPDGVRLEVEAEDRDMPGLVSTVSAPNTDNFLYEEDVLQVAIAATGAAEPAEFLLVNPHGSRKGSKAAVNWPLTAVRQAHGWKIDLWIPIADKLPCLGLSIHRFYRGIRGQVSGLTPILPHPLDVSGFAVLVLDPSANPEKAGRSYRENAVRAQQAATERILSASRQRMATAERAGGAVVSLATAGALAERRAQVPLRNHEGFLCWDESHFLHGLIDLWELTGDVRWLEMAIPRMETIWTYRADRTGAKDSFRGKALPTWYNNSETGTACTLTTGVILWPMVRLLRTIHDAPALRILWPRVQGWIPLCRESVAVHEYEWMEFPDGSGMHLEPYPKGPGRVYPRGGSRINPFNREYALTMPVLHLGRILGDEAYLRQAEMAARFFRKQCERTVDGGLVWEYEEASYPAMGEDIDHACAQVYFIDLCAAEGVVFTDADVRRVATTLARHVFRYGDVPCGTIRGYTPDLHLGIGTWSRVCHFVPEILPRIIRVVETLLREDRPVVVREGWGVRNLTCIELARRRQ